MREDRLREDQVEDDEDFLDYAEDEGSRPADGRNQRLLIITLSVGCLALAVSNVVLAMRVKAPAPEPVGKATRPPVDLPPRGTPGASVRDVPSRGSESLPAAGASRERMTAAWMVQEHGRQDAEKRARAVADFYGSSAEGAFWRRVLGEIVSDRR
jgi:hypothetical protein